MIIKRIFPSKLHFPRVINCWFNNLIYTHREIKFSRNNVYNSKAQDKAVELFSKYRYLKNDALYLEQKVLQRRLPAGDKAISVIGSDYIIAERGEIVGIHIASEFQSKIDLFVARGALRLKSRPTYVDNSTFRVHFLPSTFFPNFLLPDIPTFPLLARTLPSYVNYRYMIYLLHESNAAGSSHNGSKKSRVRAE